MSTTIEINGTDFVSVKDASKEVSYSRDYLAKLAREGKVKATQVGRQWFVELGSVQNFIENKNIEQEVYRRRLSEERRKELEVREKIDEVTTFKETKINQTSTSSLNTSFLVLGSGLALGVTLFFLLSVLEIDFHPSEKYSATVSANLENTNNFNISSEIENKVSNRSEPDNLPDKKANALGEVTVNYPVFSNESEIRKLSEADMRGIFLLTREGEVKDEKDVENMFSDEVKVRFVDENSGVVSFVNEAGEKTEFPFVSVPKRSVRDNRGVSNSNDFESTNNQFKIEANETEEVSAGVNLETNKLNKIKTESGVTESDMSTNPLEGNRQKS